jgi:hypothetical protein
MLEYMSSIALLLESYSRVAVRMWCWVNVFEVFVSVPFAMAQMAMLGVSEILVATH